MKKFFLTLMLLAMGCLAYGSDFVVTHRTPNGEMVSRVVDDEADDFSQTAMRPKAPVFKEGEEPEWITLHIKFKYPENLVPLCACYVENEIGFVTDYVGEDEIELEIVKDCFNNKIIIGMFDSTDESVNRDNCYYVFIRVHEFTDGLEIVLDANTICDKYSLELLNPVGNPLQVGHSFYDTATNTETFDGEGDVDSVFGTIIISDSFSTSPLISPVFFILNRSYSDGRPDRVYTSPIINVNPLPDGISLAAIAMGMRDANEGWLMGTKAVIEPGVMSNSAPDFVKQSFDIHDQPFKSDQFGIRYGIDYSLNGYISNGISWGGDIKVSEIDHDATVAIVMCLPQASMKDIDTVQALGSFNTIKLIDGMEIDGSASQLFMVEDGVVVYKPHNMTLGGSSGHAGDRYALAFDNWSHADFFKMVNSFIPAEVSKYKITTGNSTPSLTSLGVWGPEWGVVPDELVDMLMDFGYLTFGYTGRNGESMVIDLLTASVDTEREGEVLRYVINNDNVLIDGKVPGFNNTVLGCMIETDDWVPPTLQALMFMNKEGDVTDRFQSAEEASMIFYAGDFQYAVNEDYTEDMMIVQPVGDVKVEYAPYGSDDFVTLTVNEVPDKFFMPGYGYCYEGSLDSVDRQSENGWFDLQISLTDENGNYQTQVISPAFKIESLSGVDTVGYMRESMQIVDGRIVSNSGNAVSVYNIDGREVRNDNLAPGIYVARIGAMSHKIIVQ